MKRSTIFYFYFKKENYEIRTNDPPPNPLIILAKIKNGLEPHVHNLY